MNQLFSQISTAVAYQTGHSTTFIVALLLILIWLVTGAPFHYSDTWQSSSTQQHPFSVLDGVCNPERAESRWNGHSGKVR
jgi:Low affinity iron permease